MIIRKAKIADWPGIKGVLQSTGKFSKGDLEDVMEIILTGTGGSFVLIDSDKIIGTVSGHWHKTKGGKEANVEQIAVSGLYRGRGLGYKLLRRIIQFFKSKGNKEVYSRWTKPVVVPFYTKFGFKTAGKTKRSVDLVYQMK